MQLSMACSHRMETRMELSVAQRAMAIQSHMLTLRLELTEALRGEKYSPWANCPACGKGLKPVEIIRGFKEDPNDFTTECPKCKHRFKANLRHYIRGDYAELPFYCASQVLAQLQPLVAATIDEFKKKHPAIYHSAVVHHGTVRNAFQKIGISYTFDETFDWKEKVKPFLGQLPDTIIAEVAGVCAATIRKFRKGRRIAACTRADMLENAVV